MTTDVCQIFAYFCNPPVNVFIFLNQKEYVVSKGSDKYCKTVQSYTGQKHNPCLIIKPLRVLIHTDNAASMSAKSCLPAMFTCFTVIALNVKGLNIFTDFWCTCEILVVCAYKYIYTYTHTLVLYISPLPSPTPKRLFQDSSPGALCANRASCITASFGWIALGSGSIGTGDPSRDRLSGVWTPLECADNTPE